MTRIAFGAVVRIEWKDWPALEFDALPAWRAHLRSLAGKRVKVTVSRETRGRTLPQNSWLWGSIYPILSDWSGHSMEEIHSAMKELHGLKDTVQVPERQPGNFSKLRTFRLPRSTRDYPTDEFSAYVERVRAWAAQQGLDIPDPGRVG